AKIFYDVALGRWLADHVPYARRGRVIGFVEMSWALGLLVGVSVMGLLTAWLDWRWAYGGAGLAIAVFAVTTPTRIGAAGEPALKATAAAQQGPLGPAPVPSAPLPARRALGRRGWLAVATMFAMCAAAEV